MFNLKVLVVCTEDWKSRKEKHARIKKLMEKGGTISVSFTEEKYTGGKPEIVKGSDGKSRISEKWFEDNISITAKIRGFNQAIFSYSMDEGDEWDVDSGLRGSSYNDGDYFGEGWVKSDENSISRFEDGSKRDRYEKTLPHEIGHCLKHHGLTKLEIHDFDFQDSINNLEGFYNQLRITDTKKNDLSYLLNLYKLAVYLFGVKSESVSPFFDREYPVTQSFNVPNSLYPQTGMHIGTDYGVPVGTYLYAPYTGTITETGFTKDLGNYIIFSTVKGYFRFCHMSRVAEKGKYRRGEYLGKTGNTGLSSGPHCHVELWKKKVEVSKLTKSNISEYLLDVTKLK